MCSNVTSGKLFLKILLLKTGCSKRKCTELARGHGGDFFFIILRYLTILLAFPWKSCFLLSAGLLTNAHSRYNSEVSLPVVILILYTIY